MASLRWGRRRPSRKAFKERRTERRAGARRGCQTVWRTGATWPEQLKGRAARSIATVISNLPRRAALRSRSPTLRVKMRLVSRLGGTLLVAALAIGGAQAKRYGRFRHHRSHRAALRLRKCLEVAARGSTANRHPRPRPPFPRSLAQATAATPVAVVTPAPAVVIAQVMMGKRIKLYPCLGLHVKWLIYL